MSAPPALQLKTAVSLLHEVEQQLRHVAEILKRPAPASSDPGDFVASTAIAIAQVVKHRLEISRAASAIRQKLDQAINLAHEAAGDAAVWDSEEAVTPDSVVARAHYVRGMLALGLGDSRTAVEWFEKSLAFVDTPMARDGIGDALMFDGEPKKAADAFQAVIDDHPQSDEAVEALKIVPRLRAVRQRSRNVALVLALLFGWLGADRFYLGYWGMGFLKLFTMGGFFVFWALDLLRILFGRLRDANGWRLKS